MDPDYIDLRAGWRLRVITPLLKSGGYRLRLAEQQVSGNTVSLSGADDLEGYETAFYAVEPRREGGVRVAFVSAEVTKEGSTSRQPRPRAPLFQLPRAAKLVRLIYLKRVSPADHDMAVVAASETGALESMTSEVQSSPSACKNGNRSFCSWVPVGIAVRPEARTAAGSAEQWDPVR